MTTFKKTHANFPDQRQENIDAERNAKEFLFTVPTGSGRSRGRSTGTPAKLP
jgi:hypothetical protein